MILPGGWKDEDCRLHDEDGNILETEPSVYAITSGGPIFARKELKLDVTAMELALASFLIRGNYLVIWRVGDQGACGEDNWPLIPGVQENREIPSSFYLGYADRRQAEYIIGQILVE
jgi:hypothetical protein